MSTNFWFAVMHVMGKLGIWKPYLIWVEMVLNALGESIEAEDS